MYLAILDIKQDAMDIIIRGIDRNLYRRLKSRAALLGYKLSAAVQEAIRVWLEASEKSVETESDANNREYERLKADLLEEHRGRFAGVANTLQEAGKIAREAGSRRALIVKLGEEEAAGGEWLWSSIELSTA